MRRGLRTRLVTGGALVAALMLFTALLVARLEISAMLQGADQRLALADIAPYVTDLRRGGNEKPDPPSTGVLIAVRSPNGAVVTDTMPADVRSRLSAAPTATVQTTSAQFVVARRQVSTASGTWTIWAAHDATARAILGGNVDLVLLLTGVTLTVAFAAAANLLVRAALRPVDRLRSRAADLGPTELLPIPAGGDELAKLAETLNQFFANTRASTEHERRMISNAAHELRTPITNPRAAIDLARQHPTGDRLDELARMSDRLGDLASNLLELSRLDEGARPQLTAAADLEDAVLTAIDGWRTRIAVSGTDVDIDHRTAVARADLLIAMDVVAAGRVIDNLLANAIAAINGPGVVLVSLGIDHSGLTLEVEDDGPGLATHLTGDVFDRFVRGSADGSGLGLALVRAIAVAGDGTAQLESTDRGVHVTVWMPVVPGGVTPGSASSRSAGAVFRVTS